MSQATVPRRGTSATPRGAVFAGVLLMISGIMNVFQGITAIATDDVYRQIGNYTFKFSTTSWGWIHLVLGAALFVVGLGLFSQSAWAGVGALVVAMLSAVANFFFIPYYPIWALVLIALDVWVIWALCVWDRGSARAAGL